MPNIEQSGLILALANALREHGSWAGETHIQKAGYLLQHLVNVPLGVNFILYKHGPFSFLYKHGPFSFNLRAQLAEMESEQFVTWEPRPFPYGPTMMPGRSGELLLAVASSPKQYHAQIDFVAEKLANKRVTDLERLAAALYVTQEPGVAREQRPARINALKPHVTIQDAVAAVEEIDHLQTEAQAKELIVEGHGLVT
jgi:hypothetical protein